MRVLRAEGFVPGRFYSNLKNVKDDRVRRGQSEIVVVGHIQLHWKAEWGGILLFSRWLPKAGSQMEGEQSDNSWFEGA